MIVLRSLVFCLSCLFLFAGCGDDGEPQDFCSCTDREPSTTFGFGESCYDGCNWTECATGNQTERFCAPDGGT